MTRWVGRLVLANVIVYLVVYGAGQYGLLDLLSFAPGAVLARPWTLVTYMFLHGSLTHILFNMFMLWVLGPRVEARLGGARFLALYFVSGLAAALLSMLLSPNPIIGASGAIFGVMLAYARFWPRDRLLIWGVLPIEARWFVLGLTALSLFAGFTNRIEPGVAHFAHLGGFLGGWLYLTWLQHRGGAAQFRRQTRPRPTNGLLPERDRTALSRWARIPREALHEVNRAEVDRILDKINAHGLGSLTPGERETLERFSPRD